MLAVAEAHRVQITELVVAQVEVEQAVHLFQVLLVPVVELQVQLTPVEAVVPVLQQAQVQVVQVVQVLLYSRIQLLISKQQQQAQTW
jgi:hypothetical protein